MGKREDSYDPTRVMKSSSLGSLPINAPDEGNAHVFLSYDDCKL